MLQALLSISDNVAIVIVMVDKSCGMAFPVHSHRFRRRHVSELSSNHNYDNGYISSFKKICLTSCRINVGGHWVNL